MKPNLANIFIWICLISIVFTQKQIDTFNILFPQVHRQQSGRPLELVTASGGCFEWMSSSPEIIDVKGLVKDQQSCHNRGLVELKHTGPYDGSIYITATNIQTHQLSNIPVRISPIHKIEIIAKSRLMNRNQMQDLKIFAYDQQQNMFTSLEGLKFQWQLVDSTNILSKISLKNSHLSLPLQERKQIEKKGAESDIIVVKGENPGKSIVRVKCIQPGYEHLKHEITISVQQRFFINPSQAVYLITSSKYNFGLVSPSRQAIQIPKSYYKASTTSKLFKVSDSLEVSAPSTEDQTTLKVEDIRTTPSFSSDVKIYSKQPTSISLKVDEYMIVGQENKIQVELFWNKQLLKGQTKDYKIKTELIYDESKKTIKSPSRTTTTIKATYKSLVAEKRVQVVLPLTVILPSHKIVLPNDETFELKVIGGSGSYEYQINNGIATISPNGVISSKKQGQTKITIIDKRVPRNQLVLKLVVSPMSSIIPLQAHKELNINQVGPIFTSARGKNQEQYTKCSDQQITLDVNHLSQFVLDPKISLKNSLPILSAKMSKSSLVKQNLLKLALLPFGIPDFVSKFSTYIKAGDISIEDVQRYASELENYGICTVHWLKSSQQSEKQIYVFSNTNVNIRSKFRLRVYSQLTSPIEQSKKGNILMTPGSQFLWMVNGGPESWGGTLKILLNSVEQKVEWSTIKCPYQQTVLQMKLQRFNIQTQSLFLPVNQSLTIYIHCKYPSKLKLQFQNQDVQTNVLNGLKDKLVKGTLIPLDNKGDTFYNSTNLVYQSEQTAGQMKIFYNKFTFNSSNVVTSKVNIWTQKLKEGKSSFKRIQASFNYVAKDMFTLSPHPENNHLISLYNPKKTYTFNLKKISENSQVICEGSISCFYVLSTKQIRVNTTRLGSGTMKIVDRSIYQNPNLQIRFDVVDADLITLELNKVSVQVQKKLIAEVKLFYQGQIIPAWQYDSRSLLLVHEAGLRTTEIQSQRNLYEISTEKSGTYRITVQQHYPSYLQSSPVLLTVYPKFETNVPNMQYTYTDQQVLIMKGQVVVAIDCTRKIHIYGGPTKTFIFHERKDYEFFDTKYSGQSKQINLIGLKQGTQLVIFFIQTHSMSGKYIAVIQLTVTVQPIDHVNLYSIKDALINAQFRILPHLIVDNVAILSSVCNFQYKWSTDITKIKLQGIDNQRALGVNATAIKQGDAYVTLQVSKKGVPMFITTTEITIHKSLQIQLPTVIGQIDSLAHTSGNLLIPPNSGYQLDDSAIFITKISESNQNLLSIVQNNKLISGKQKGLVSLKLQKSTDQTYNNYMNVIITPIKALFVQNSNSIVKVDVGKVTNVRFYVQDMYGRLFYNNLFNVQYDLISSNEEVFSVSLDSSKNFIRIHPKKQGQGMLMIRLKSSDNTLSKINEVPHDIVLVQVGKFIEPHSPIYLAVGGQVNIQIYGKGNKKWEIVSGSEFVSVDQKKHIITGVKAGESVISINGYQVIVRVLQLTMKQKVISEPAPGNPTLIVDYIPTGKWNDDTIYFQSISNQFNHINNNLNLSCDTVNKKYFSTKSKIIKKQEFDSLHCETTMNYDFELQQNIPNDIELKVINYDEKNLKNYLTVTKRNIESNFWVPKIYQILFLSPVKPVANLFVKTTHPLQIEIIGTQHATFESQFQSKENQLIKLSVDPTSFNHNSEFKLRLTHPQTLISQQITVKYIIDESSRKAQQAKIPQSSKVEIEQPIVSSHKKATDSKGFFSGWHWTDFIILIMAINFVLILIYQTCINSNDKYKTL